MHAEFKIVAARDLIAHRLAVAEHSARLIGCRSSSQLAARRCTHFYLDRCGSVHAGSCCTIQTTLFSTWISSPLASGLLLLTPSPAPVLRCPSANHTLRRLLPLARLSTTIARQTLDTIRNGEISSYDSVGQWRRVSALHTRARPQHVVRFWCSLEPSRCMMFFFGPT